MARIRSIKPEFRTSLTVTSWPRDVRLFFALLWGYLDDSGRGVDEPRLIKADCFPLDDDISASTIDGWLNLMAKTETVVRYRAEGRSYLCIPGWADHQKTQHPKPSRIPPPGAEKIDTDDSRIPETPTEDFMRDSGSPHASRLPEQGAGSREQGDGAGRKNSSSPVADATADVDPAVSAGPDINDRPDVRGLCDLLADLMVENGCKRPTINKGWLDNARLLIDKDGREPAKAATLIKWSQNHTFWRSNIRSMATFRSQYDALRLQALDEWQKQQGVGATRFSNGSPTASRTDAALLELAGRYSMPEPDEQPRLAIGGMS